MHLILTDVHKSSHDSDTVSVETGDKSVLSFTITTVGTFFSSLCLSSNESSLKSCLLVFIMFKFILFETYILFNDRGTFFLFLFVFNSRVKFEVLFNQPLLSSICFSRLEIIDLLKTLKQSTLKQTKSDSSVFSPPSHQAVSETKLEGDV